MFYIHLCISILFQVLPVGFLIPFIIAGLEITETLRVIQNWSGLRASLTVKTWADIEVTLLIWDVTFMMPVRQKAYMNVLYLKGKLNFKWRHPWRYIPLSQSHISPQGVILVSRFGPHPSPLRPLPSTHPQILWTASLCNSSCFCFLFSSLIPNSFMCPK